uniref:EF-hand calcium-binding domain-containing protein 14-like isoform X2 n=1 Tax=Geotrypetes seraphini TaxID=260995 RepID=A0A6P8Q0U0_GEOSA|nr:EF-hand calcium-binding domain-containing protein 14-like isoform X2 [Geotrypetes seraphini]
MSPKILHCPRKVYVGTTGSRKYASWKQCPWLLHSFLILLLITSQAIMGIFLFLTHGDLEMIKYKQATIFGHETNYSSNVEHNTSSAELRESQWQAWKQQNNEVMSLTPDQYRALKAFRNKNTSLEQRVNALEMRMQFLEVTVSRRTELVDPPASKSRGEEAKNAVDSQIKETEGRLMNLSKAVYSLQRRLEEGLETVFLRLSHLQDELYMISNSSNHKHSKILDSYRTAPNPKEPDSRTPVTDSPMLTSGSRTVWSLTTQQRPAEQQRTTGREGQINIPSIKSHQDFQVFFYGADSDADGFLKYSDIQQVLEHNAPKKEELQRFDENNDHTYSYLELLKAFTFTD